LQIVCRAAEHRVTQKRKILKKYQKQFKSLQEKVEENQKKQR
jgi:uncharacterized coiled-coil protein SlyX